MQAISMAVRRERGMRVRGTITLSWAISKIEG